MRVLMILFAIVALIWLWTKDINHEVKVNLSEPPLPQEYIIINKATQDLAINDNQKSDNQSLRSPIWDTIDNNKEALKRELIKGLSYHADKPEIFILTNLLYLSEIPKHNKHARLLTTHKYNKNKVKDKIIEKLKEGDRRLFKSILSYLKPAGDKAKEICDSYSYSKCNPYVNVLVDLGSVYNLEHNYIDAIVYLKTATEHLECFEDTKLSSPQQEAHTQLGLSYLGLKRFDDAVSELEASKPKAMSFTVQMSGWESELATALQKAGYPEAAKAYWKEEVIFWEKEIAGNTENKHLLQIKIKMKEKAKNFLNNLPK